MKKILFVVYGGGHSKMIRPVVERLLDLGGVKVSVLALTSAKEDFSCLDVELLGYKDFFNDESILYKGRELANGLEKVFCYDETVSYLGQNYEEMINFYGEKLAANLYRKKGRQVFYPVESMKQVLLDIEPDLLVVTDSPRSEKAALEAACILGIPSLALITMFPYRSASWLASNKKSEKVCVLMDSVKDYLVSNGKNESDVIVTGNPAFDQLARCYAVAKKVKEKNGFRVLWASQDEPSVIDGVARKGNPGLPLLVEKKLAEIFSCREDWKLVVRNHPNEMPREYPDYVEVSRQDERIEDLLKNIDVVVTMGSTVGFQGVVMGAQLLTIDDSIYSELIPYSKLGLSRGVAFLDELESVLLETYSLKNDAVCQYGTIDAANRIVSEVKRIIE